MTANEIFRAIQKLPLAEQRALAEQLQEELATEGTSAQEASRREREFENEMFAERFFSHIPTGPMSDEEFDEYEPLELEGEPLSEQIIRERI